MREHLKMARQNQGLTQDQIANRIGLEVTSYQRIEAGTRGTSEDNWLRLFNLFKQTVPLHELMDDSAKVPHEGEA